VSFSFARSRSGVSGPSSGSGAPSSRPIVALGALVLAIAVFFGAASAIADEPPVVTIGNSPTAEYTTAEVSGTVNPSGGPSTTYWYFEYTTTPADDSSWQPGPGGEISGPEAEGTSAIPVNGTIQGLHPETEYSVRLVAENGEFANRVATEAPYPTFTTKGPVAKATVSLDPVTTFDDTTAHFSGAINPGAGSSDPGFKVHYEFLCTPSCLDPNGNPLGGQLPADNSSHTVEVTATGLEPNTDYSVKLLASNAGGAESAGPQSFHTTAIGPSAETVPAFAVQGGTEALVGARVNPHNSATTYWIEYGTTTAYGSSAPLSEDASAGSGGAPQVFTQKISGLTPSTVYHFRVVAENAFGTVEGDDKNFETAPAGPAPQPSCPNASLRAENNSTGLSECRAYEQVSPVDKNGFDAGMNFGQQNYVASTDGSAVFFQSFGGFGDAKTSAVLNQYLSRRGSDGWETKGLSPAQKIKSLNGGNPLVPWLTPDLRYALVEGGQQGHLAPGDDPDVSNGYRYDTLTGTYVTVAATPFAAAGVGGGTADGSRIFFENTTPLTPEAEGAVTGRGVYEWHEGQLKLVSILPNEEPAPDAFFQTSAGPLQNEVSADGSRVVFKAGDATGQLQLYLREDGERTLKVSASRGGSTAESELFSTVYVGAAADGSKIYFQTRGNLTPDASGDVEKLYRFEPETETLTNLTSGALPGSRQEITSHGTAASGVAGISPDGEYVYFYSPSKFHPGDNLGGGSGLYVWHNGAVRFIGPDDGSMNTNSPDVPSRMSPNGLRLSFTSSARMTAYDNTDTVPAEGGGPRRDVEVYTYDFASDRLTCVSCNPSGQPPSGAPNGGPPADSELPSLPVFQSLNRQPGVRDDGSVFFSSRDALVPQDVNGKQDVYLWKHGRVDLISSGSGGSDSFLASSSASDDDVFFLTRQQLVASDKDDSADIYDARVGGGFPQPVPPSLCEGIEGCQGAAGNPPPFTDPASGSFSSSLKRLDPDAQRLRKALKACKHKKKKKARAKCRAAAKKRYGKASKGRTH
jgi:hypothetical protein